MATQKESPMTSREEIESMLSYWRERLANAVRPKHIKMAGKRVSELTKQLGAAPAQTTEGAVTMSGRGGIYEGPDGSKLHGDGREVKAMSQTDKERAILEAVDSCHPSSDGERFCLYSVIEKVYDAGAKAGYIAAKEDAAKLLELRTLSRPAHSDYVNPYSVAAAIRKLEP